MKKMVSVRTARMALVAVSALTAVASASAQAVFVRGFEGTSQLDNCALGQCFRPPDTMGAVGTTQYLETNNGSIAIFDKATGALQQRFSMPAWWTSVGLPGGASGDQRVLFDHYTNRWIMNGFGSSGNRINLAVSDTADALGTWKSIAITVIPTGTADYPTLSMDDKGVYIGTNNFTPSFTGTSLVVIPKADLFGGTPTLANMTQFNTANAGTDQGFAIQPALNWQGNPTNTVSVIADSRLADAQVFYKVSGVNGPGATQTVGAQIAGTAYIVAGPGRQPDGSRLVDTLSPRITANAVQHDGKIFSTATVRGTVGDFAAVRWTVVDANSGTLLSTGFIEEAGYDFYEGSIAINEFGEAVIGYNRSGTSTADGNGDGLADGNISFMARAYDLSGNALVQDGAEMTLRVSGISDYRCGARSPVDTTCRQRWGDYAAVTIDPNDHHKFYAIGEYASAWAVIPGVTTTERAIWNTYVAEIAMVPEPGTYGMMALGLGVIGFIARRRRPQA